MTNSLYNKLQIYYGELLYELQTSYDYFEKRKIQNKLEAIELLLNINV